jgi:hypothetical protein
VALVPITIVRRILDFCGERRHRPLEGIVPIEFEPLWDFEPESAAGLSGR